MLGIHSCVEVEVYLAAIGDGQIAAEVEVEPGSHGCMELLDCQQNLCFQPRERDMEMLEIHLPGFEGEQNILFVCVRMCVCTYVCLCVCMCVCDYIHLCA